MTEIVEEIIDEVEEEVEESKYNRIKYLENGDLDLEDPNTLLISQMPKTKVLNEEIKQKLIGYRIVEKSEFNNLVAGDRRWYRAIKIRNNKTTFISGGFLIKNGEQFLTLLNISMRFSFNIQKNEIILFQKETEAEKLNPLLKQFLENRNYKKKVKVLISEDLKTIIINKMISKIVKEDDNIKRKSLVKAFTKQQNKYKNYFIMSIDEEDVETFKINFSKLQEQVGNDIIVNPTRDLINLLVDTSFQ